MGPSQGYIKKDREDRWDLARDTSRKTRRTGGTESGIHQGRQGGQVGSSQGYIEEDKEDRWGLARDTSRKTGRTGGT